MISTSLINQIEIVRLIDLSNVASALDMVLTQQSRPIEKDTLYHKQLICK